MRYLAAVLALSIIAVTASAQERRPFPVATAVGKSINRVVGFPFRVAAAAVGIDPQRRAAVRVRTQNVQVDVGRRGIVRVDAPRVQVRVNQPVVRQIRVQRIGAAYHHNDVQQIRVQRIGAAYHHNEVQQVRVIRQPVVVTERQHITYTAAAGATSQIYSDPVVTQRVEVEEPPILQEVAKPTVQRVTIQRVTSGHCGSASSFRY
jgi:hypothetical protein